MDNHDLAYSDLLTQELVPAQGCTEPIALAFASARATCLLGRLPDKILIEACGNIVKNVKSVVVPNTGGLKGLKAAAVAGAVGGRPELMMEVLRDMTPEQIAACRDLLHREGFCETKILKTQASLHFIVTVEQGSEKASVEIIHSHTNIVRETRNGQVLLDRPALQAKRGQTGADRSFMTMQGIYHFITSADIRLIREPVERQISCNRLIADEGLLHPYGLCVGQVLMAAYGDETKTKASASAAAGSDARMSGCILPVVINSGSGNQGLAVSLPVITFARKLKVSDERLIRALALSNLVAIYQKTLIGRLSAYCGAVCAACGSGAAITFLYGHDFDCICATIKNTLANIAGMVCDGAKPSCAAKIASAVDAAILGHTLAVAGHCVQSGDGLILEDIDSTIRNYGRLACDGMKETDGQILQMMIKAL